MKLGKKLLSLLTVLCLTLSLFPTMAFATDDGRESAGTPANSVSVGSVRLNSATPYLVNGKPNGQSTITEQEKTAGYIYFDASNSTLTLNNYSSTTSHPICGNTREDLIIQLIGDNYITSSGNGIRSYGKLTISGPGKLTLTNASNGTTIHAIDTITIKGGANIIAPGGYNGQSIHLQAENKEIIITGSNTVVNAIDSTRSTGIVRCGNEYNGDDNKGIIRVNDGATLNATKIEGTLLINGKTGSLTNDKAEASVTYTVSGTVKNGDTPVADASVQLCTTGTDATTSVIATSTTDSNGEYRLTGISEGSYTIKASKNEYDVWSEAIQINADSTSKNITLTQSATYNVWVGGTQVTSANKDNVLNDANATVKYTPADEGTAQKLTLNGMSITNTSQIGITASNDLTIALSGENNISGSAHAIEMTNGTLTITGPGSLNASSNSGQTTVYTNGNVTIKGGAKITATNTSGGNGDVFDIGNSENKHTLSVTGTGTQVTAQKTVGSEVAINHISTLTVNDGATLTAQSNGTAISCDTFTRGVGYTVNVDATNYDGSGATASYQDSSRTTYKYVKAEPGNTTPTPVISYGVWVGNTKVTSVNASNVLNDGTVSYNPDTKTLTLTNAAITGAANRAYTSAITDACGIYSTHALTINLVGSNTVNGATTSAYGNYGIFVSGKLTFTSDSNGSIIVSGGVSTNNGNAWVPGVYASGITVNNCNVTVSGGTAEGDKYPVSYAMSTAPTLVGVKATASRNRDGSYAET